MRWSVHSRFNGFLIRPRWLNLVNVPKKPGVDMRTVRARDILDQAFGKKEVTSSDAVAEVERLEAEVKRLREKLEN
jgi:hypothetical protein